jgi:predicted  nucleic acid-binding Zn-ribbon protein
MGKVQDNVVPAAADPKVALQMTFERSQRLIEALEQDLVASRQSVVGLEWQIDRLNADLEKSRAAATQLRQQFRNEFRRRRRRSK